MNVKAGDMAYIVGGGRLAGLVVQVLHRAPIGVDFKLPDGFKQCAQDYEWVVRFCLPVEAPIGFGKLKTGTRLTIYDCAPDSKLRPISGVPLEDEVTEDLKEPA